jgi:predicted PhzF superfamily epimerase YddE/YHI9
MTIPLFHVDAFADGPFTGNPAAVCLLPAWKNDRWLSGVAAEMNLSETAFLVRRADGYDLRWLTPTVEVDLCGHATLASAHVLWRHGFADDDKLRFSTRSGVLTAVRRGEEVELDFPLTPAEPADPPPGLLESLGTKASYVGRSRFDYLVEVASGDELRRLAPDFQKLAAVSARGVIVTARSDDGRFDFVSRFFAPAAGVAEDPVTGSAHCCLADHWQRRLGKGEFTAYQASARGGVVQVRVDGGRAKLAGRAVTIAKGELLIGGDA